MKLPFAKKPVTPDTIGDRLATIADTIERLRATSQAHQVERQQAAQAVARLTEEAAAGTLKDARRLTSALQHQRSLDDGQDHATSIAALEAERITLEAALHEAQRQQAREEYQAAVMALAQGCKPILELQKAVQEAAARAGVEMGPGVTRWPVEGRSILIGSAVIDLVALP